MIPIEQAPLSDDDIETILHHVGSIDGQPRTADDFETWRLAANVGRWTRAEATAGLAGLLLGFSGFRINPAHLTEQIKAVRDKVRHLWNPPDPPRELRDNPAAEIAWRRAALRSFTDRAMLAVASGEPAESVPMLPPRQAVRVLEAPPMPDAAAAQFRAAVAAMGQKRSVAHAITGPVDVERVSPSGRFSRGDAAERERARAELERVRPAE